MKNVILSVASIRSKVLDFERNSTLIIEAIKKANQDGASILVTPEMGLTG
jgi:predicted amidohydrolase